MYQALGLPRLSRIGVQVGDMMAGLVPVPILVFCEESVQEGRETVFPAHMLHQPFDIVRHEPGVMVGSSLAYVGSLGVGIEGLVETPVGVPAAGISGPGVDHVLPVGGPLQEAVPVGVMPQLACNLGEDEVVICIFQRPGGLLPLVESLTDRIFHRDITVPEVGIERPASLPVLVGGIIPVYLEGVLPHQGICLFMVESVEPLHYRVSDHGYPMVPDHCGSI